MLYDEGCRHWELITIWHMHCLRLPEFDDAFNTQTSHIFTTERSKLLRSVTFSSKKIITLISMGVKKSSFEISWVRDWDFSWHWAVGSALGWLRHKPTYCTFGSTNKAIRRKQSWFPMCLNCLACSAWKRASERRLTIFSLVSSLNWPNSLTGDERRQQQR